MLSVVWTLRSWHTHPPILSPNSIFERKSMKGGDCPVIENSTTVAVLESLESLFSGLTWWSSWKVSETHFSSQNWAKKPQNCPNSISHEPLVVETWLNPQNDLKTWFTVNVLRYVYLSDPRKCPKNAYFFFVFWGLNMMKLHGFPYLVNYRSYKVR